MDQGGGQPRVRAPSQAGCSKEVSDAAGRGRRQEFGEGASSADKFSCPSLSLEMSSDCTSLAEAASLALRDSA